MTVWDGKSLDLALMSEVAPDSSDQVLMRELRILHAAGMVQLSDLPFGSNHPVWNQLSVGTRPKLREVGNLESRCLTPGLLLRLIADQKRPGLDLECSRLHAQLVRDCQLLHRLGWQRVAVLKTKKLSDLEGLSLLTLELLQSKNWVQPKPRAPFSFAHWFRKSARAEYATVFD